MKGKILILIAVAVAAVAIIVSQRNARPVSEPQEASPAVEQQSAPAAAQEPATTSGTAQDGMSGMSGEPSAAAQSMWDPNKWDCTAWNQDANRTCAQWTLKPGATPN